MSLSQSDILSNPDYYPLQFEGANLIFVKMSRQTYRESTFTLPSRIVTEGDQAWRVPFADVVALTEAAPKVADSFCLFQIAHCGSTLLSKALDIDDKTLVIREPFALRQLLSSPQTRDPALLENRTRGLRAIWYLLSRRYAANAPVLIKGNVPFNFHLAELFETTSLSRGLFLYSDLEDYLLAVVKDESRCQWAQHVTVEMAAHINALDQFAGLELTQLSPLRAAAVLWLSQQLLLQRALEQSLNLKPVQSKALFTDPLATVHECATALGLAYSMQDSEQLSAGELLKTHAKDSRQAYSSDIRQQELAQLKSAHQNELDKTQAWMSQFNPS